MTTTARPQVPPTYVNANRLWVDSLPRAVAQRGFEAHVLRQLGLRVEAARVLELGPGRRGTGTRIALGDGAAHVTAVELHPASAVACRTALRDVADRVEVREGDATALPDAGGTYRAAVGYHVLHHAEDWRAIVAEAGRVLAPGGRFGSAEMTARFVDSRALRAVSHHPRDADRPTPEGIAAACEAAGLRVLGQRTQVLGWWTALVAEKQG